MAKNWTVEQLHPEDSKVSFVNLVRELSENMRERDRLDLADTCEDIEWALIASLRLSEELYVYRDDKGNALCVVGKCLHDDSCVGRAIWMVGTNYLYDGYVKTILFKEAKKLINRWVKEHGLLYNCVHEDNIKSIRYMTWLGAKWLPEMTKRNGKKFHNFYIAGGDA